MAHILFIIWIKTQPCMFSLAFNTGQADIHDKTNKITVCPAKTQISLGIHAV